MPDMADDDYLARWGHIFNVPRKPATAASGAVTFSGLPLPIPSGLPLLAEDKTTLFTTTASATIPTGGSVTVTIAAAQPDAAANLDAGAILTPRNCRRVAGRHGGSARDQWRS
jgi:uncharacterized phage protein gp47/JayE